MKMVHLPIYIIRYQLPLRRITEGGVKEQPKQKSNQKQEQVQKTAPVVKNKNPRKPTKTR